MDIRDCPCCGSKADVGHNPIGNGKILVKIYCTGCHLSMTEYLGDMLSMERLHIAWNKRTTDPKSLMG